MLQEFQSYLANELNRSPLTLEAYLRDIRQFQDWLGAEEDFNPETVTLNDIRAWMASLSRRGLAARTLRRKAESLRAFFRFLRKRKGLPSNPAAALTLPKTPKSLPDIVTDNDVENAIETLSQQVSEQPGNIDAALAQIVVETLYSLGLRRAELIALNDADISFSAGEIKVTGKRSKQRVLPVPETLLAKIKAWQDLRDSQNQPYPHKLQASQERPGSKPLFAVNGKRISPVQVYTIVRQSLAQTSARKKSPHSLRHSFATSMLNSGAEINSVKEFLGHASLSTTQIYTHISFAEMQKAYSSAHPRSKESEKN